MKSILMATITICAVAAAGLMIFKSLHAANNAPRPTAAPAVKLPPAYSDLKIGMSEDQVVALIGKPDSRSINPRFQVKTPAQWAALHKQEEAASNDNDLSGAPSATEIRIGGILAHQVKENWRYAPKGGNAYASLAFDGAGHLLKWGSGVAPMARGH